MTIQVDNLLCKTITDIWTGINDNNFYKDITNEKFKVLRGLKAIVPHTNCGSPTNKYQQLLMQIT